MKLEKSRKRSSKNKPSGRRQLFNSTDVVTAIKSALTEDLLGPALEYGLKGDASKYGQYRQLQEFEKKFLDPLTKTDDLESKTFEKFLGIVDHLMTVDLDLPKSDVIRRGTSYRDRVLLRARSLMHFVLSDFDEEEWFTECKNSRGSTVGCPYTDTSPERKLTFPITLTAGVESLFDQYLLFDKSLKRAIEAWNTQQQTHVLGRYEIVQGSRASTVEKNADIRRMICVEPSGNMFFQQGLMHMIYKRMKAVNLDVETLPYLHQRLARISSITGRLATIDWTSASDCVLIELLKWLIPPKWFAVCEQTRSPNTRLNNAWIKLPMFATMGNAVTFPLETLVFWTIATAVVSVDKDRTNSVFPEWEHIKSCSVFGDDCIVPTSSTTSFIEVMESVGFLVNSEKSHVEYRDRFRESCGGDYLAGRSVRPYHIRPPSSAKQSAYEPWLYTILNALSQKYVLYFGGISYLYDKELFRCMFGLFQKNNLRLRVVPSDFPDDAGWKVPIQELFRFRRHYAGLFIEAPLYANRHGTVSFSFCKFNYWQSGDVDPGIRCALSLKKLRTTRWVTNRLSFHTLPVDEPLRTKRWSDYLPKSKDKGAIPFQRPIRRKGGYTVGKSKSAHWFSSTELEQYTKI